MVVDDEDNALLIRDYFQLSGFNVVVYFGLERGGENFKKGQYDLAILDIRFPHIDGFELYKRLEGIDNNLRVCFLTGLAIKVNELHYDLRKIVTEKRIVQKPVHLSELVRIIKLLLNGNDEQLITN